MKTLYSKFAVTTILIMLISGVISFLISNIYYQNSLKEQNDLKMTKIAQEISSFINKHNDIDLNDYFDHLGSIGYQIHIIDENGKRLFFGAEYREQNLPDAAINRVLKGNFYHGIREFPHKTFVTGFFANELRNTVGVPFEYQETAYALFLRPDIKLLFSEMHIMFGWLILGMIAFSIVLVLVSTKFLVKPISKLNSATTLIAEGNFGIQLNINRNDEIGKLAASFYSMARKLEKVSEMRREFISNISHDIQSPLSNIKGYMKLLKNGQLTTEDSQYIEAVDAEVTRLSNLTKQLLLLSSIDSKKELMDSKTFDIGGQIKKVVRQYQWNLSEKGILISYALPETFVKGDPSLLYSVWENLMTNAIKYSEDNGEIEILLKEGPSWIEVSFRDEGIGMGEDELRKIYDRFYRADSSRTRSIEGTGLGLSIVRSIIEMHKGEIRVESIKRKGSNFTVILPKE